MTPDMKKPEDGLGLEGIYHAFGKAEVVRGVSLSVPKGELACLLGPSGCGKTTLLRLAAGLEILQKGWITIGEDLVGNGETGLHIPPERRGIGLMFQDYALFPHLNVRDNIAFGLEGRPGKEKEKAGIDQALDRIGLGGIAEAYPHTLSGGQQQRVALLRAIAPGPRALLLDEPFSGLDVSRRAQVREETLSIVKETGAASLMVTHDPEEAMFMADRIFIMNEGRIIQAGVPDDIYHQPVNAFVAELFGPINRCNGRVKNGRVATPMGEFDAPGISDGTRAQVLVRPEALRVFADETDSDIPIHDAKLLSARLLGRSTHLNLELTGGDGGVTHFQARTPGTFAPPVDGTVRIGVKAAEVFVFPLEDL